MPTDNRTSVLRFVERSLTVLADRIEALDPETTFAISLFLAGAADRFAVASELNNIQRFILIRETVGALDTRSETVDAFTQQFTDHSKNAKYSPLIEAGRRVMDNHLAEDTDCFANLPGLISDWLHSHAGTELDAPEITIMITDLVDLHAAPEIVRTHNSIVRAALAKTHGEETEHTGDGIIASFSNTLAAVRAGIRIQQAVNVYNSKNPENTMALRIGIHAGEAQGAIDLLASSTVKMTATICVQAEDGEILVSGAVQKQCQGQGFDLKDVDGELYKVVI